MVNFLYGIYILDLTRGFAYSTPCILVTLWMSNRLPSPPRSPKPSPTHTKRKGFLIIATRVPLNEFNHQELACDVARDFRLAYREVESLYGRSAARRIPLFGLGHSLGAKVHVLLNSYPEVSDVAKRRKVFFFFF